MRIICDHCDHQIFGAVKVLAGSLNLHPECMRELGKETKPKSTATSWQSQESSVMAFVDASAIQAM